MIYANVKKKCTEKGIDVIDKGIYRLMLGEFSRINDGKEISDEQAVAVIKKMKAGVVESRKHLKTTSMRFIQSIDELRVYDSFLPTPATYKDMEWAVSEIFEKEIFKNPMQAMKPVKAMLEGMGYMVDGNELRKVIIELKE